MNNVQIKYERLDASGQKEVDKLINILSKKPEKKVFDGAAFKKKLLEAPTWSENDIKDLEENIAQFRNWKINEW